MRHKIRLLLVLVVVATACAPHAYRNREPLPDCGEERLEDQLGPFNAEARECFADAIANGGSAELRLFGFDEEGGKLGRTLRIDGDHAEEFTETSDIGWIHDVCDGFRVTTGLQGLPGFNGIGCTAQD